MTCVKNAARGLCTIVKHKTTAFTNVFLFAQVMKAAGHHDGNVKWCVMLQEIGQNAFVTHHIKTYQLSAATYVSLFTFHDFDVNYDFCKSKQF